MGMLSTVRGSVALTLACSLVLAIGCGGSASSQAKTRTPFTERDGELFDDGLDLITSVLALEGRWREEWQAELNDRVRSAEFIAVVSVRTLRTDTDPQGRVTHRLFVRPSRVLRGEVDEEEIELASRADSRGFRTIDGHLQRVETGTFLACLKWYVNEEGAEGVHWHLSPASEEVVAAAARLVGEGSTPKATVIVHQHTD